MIKLLRPLYRSIIPILRRQLVPDLDCGRISFSQDGEDLVLESLFQAVPPVAKFYIDVGAYHPKRLSNTYFFYRQGWQGINIDAMPGSMQIFEQERPRDINVEAAISSISQTLTYYMFKEQGLNTLNDNVAQKRINSVSNPHCQLIGKRQFETHTLTEILSEKLPTGQQIGFLNVDVEGLDLDVLSSLDFSKYLPQCIVVEHKAIDPSKQETESSIPSFLWDKGYCRVGMTHRSSIFILRSCHMECDMH